MRPEAFHDWSSPNSETPREPKTSRRRFLLGSYCTVQNKTTRSRPFQANEHPVVGVQWLSNVVLFAKGTRNFCSGARVKLSRYCEEPCLAEPRPRRARRSALGALCPASQAARGSDGDALGLILLLRRRSVRFKETAPTSLQLQFHRAIPGEFPGTERACSKGNPASL